MIHRKAVVIGDIILNKTVVVRAIGPSPDNAATMLTEELSTNYRLGGAAFVAECLRSLQVDTSLCGFNSNTEVAELLSDIDVTTCIALPKPGADSVVTHIETVTGQRLLQIKPSNEISVGQDQSWWKTGKPNRILATVDSRLSDDTLPIFCLVNRNRGCLTSAATKAIMAYIKRIHETYNFAVVADPGYSGLWEPYGSPRTIFRVNLVQAYNFARHLLEVGMSGVELPYDDTYDPYVANKGKANYFAFHVTANNLKRAGIPYAHLVMTFGMNSIMTAPSENTSNSFYMSLSGDKHIGEFRTTLEDNGLAAFLYGLAKHDTDPLSIVSVTNACENYVYAVDIACHESPFYCVSAGDLELEVSKVSL